MKKTVENDLRTALNLGGVIPQVVDDFVTACNSGRQHHLGFTVGGRRFQIENGTILARREDIASGALVGSIDTIDAREVWSLVFPFLMGVFIAGAERDAV